MGARAAKQCAANRSAKKQVSASPAPEGSASRPVENQVSALTMHNPNLLMSFKEPKEVALKCKARGIFKNPPATSAPTEDNQALTEASDDSSEVTPRCPERQAREGFRKTLANIVEEPENDKTGSIGSNGFREGDWEMWKPGFDDEFDLRYEYDLDSVSTTNTGCARPLGQHSGTNKCFKRQPRPKTSRANTKGEQKLKRKHQDLDFDSESESEVEGECVSVFSLDALH